MHKQSKPTFKPNDLMGSQKSPTKILDRRKMSEPTIINSPAVIKSSSDKAKLFAKSFRYNPTLDNKGHLFLDFDPLREYNLSNISITAREILSKVMNLRSLPVQIKSQWFFSYEY